MKKSKFPFSIIAIILAVLLLLGSILPLLPVVFGEEEATIDKKNEIVYASLSPLGQVKGIYVVNHFEILEAGLITDHGAYSKVINLSDTGEIELTDENVSFSADKGNFYYQGNMDKASLPWLFNIDYSLDGASIEPEELAGKSGALKINISTKANKDIDKTFYDNYMLQISLALDGDICRNIEAPDAVMASSGKDRLLNFTLMPGKDADFTITSEVEGFYMAGIEIAATPFDLPFDLPDTEEMMGELESLTDAIGEVNDGLELLSSGISELSSGVSSLVTGSESLSEGLSNLDEASSTIGESSGTIAAGLAEIATQVAGFIPNIDMEDTKNADAKEDSASLELDLEELLALPEGLSQMAQGLEQISQGLDELYEGQTNMYTMLDQAIMDLPTIAEEDMMVLYGYLATLDDSNPNKAVIGQLLDAYVASQTLFATYTFEDPTTSLSMQEALNMGSQGLEEIGLSTKAIGSSLEEIATGANLLIADITDMTDMDMPTMIEGLEQLALGLLELSEGYEEFDSGLALYLEGVVGLAQGYEDMHEGITELELGVKELAEGGEELYSGTSELADKTSDLPATLKEEIDELMSEYTGKDFDPVSFTSFLNSHTRFVQFVFMAEGIELATEEKAPQALAPEKSFWDKISSLFD